MVAPYTFRPEVKPAVRENTPLRIGIAGPTKSGKTYSGHRLARGLAAATGGPVVMLNAEGRLGHSYADKFKYLACELTAPYRPQHYTEALKHFAQLNPYPGCILIDSTSHMQDGPGGIVEWHSEIALRMAKGNADLVEKMNAPAWVEPKHMENLFIYQLQEMVCPVVLCFRAKEKIRITKQGKWEDLGWRPIASDRVAFETNFTLMLPPYSKGVPDLDMSEMREPYDTLVPKGKQIDEDLGRILTEWAKGRAAETVKILLEEIQAMVASRYPGQTPADKESKAALLEQAFGVRAWSKVQAMDEQTLRAGIEKLRQPAEAGRAQEADRGGNSPVTREHASHQEQQPAPKERPKEGDEPSPGLFPSTKDLKPETKKPEPAGTTVTGVDVDDEAQVLAKAIEEEKAKLDRQPPDEKWDALCTELVGTTVLEMADPAALQELLELVKQLVAQDPDAIARVTQIIAEAGA